MSDTIERVLFNPKNGQLAVGIRLRFMDKYCAEEIGKLDGYELRIEPTNCDAYAIDNEQGIWIVVANGEPMKGIEDWGPL